MTIVQDYAVPNAGAYNSYTTPDSLYRRYCVRDTGADVQSRFSYQAVCVLLYAFYRLLDEESDDVAIYCELVEDFLVKRSDGTYVAVQVKTRNRDQGPFKTSNRDMLASLHRFAKYEDESDSDFYRYIIASNAGFWKARNWKSLVHIKESAATTGGELTGDFAPLVTSVKSAADDSHSCSHDQCILGKVFFKLMLDDKLPAFGSEMAILHSELSKRITNRTTREIEYVVKDLLAFVKECSDRSREDGAGIHQLMADDPEASRIRMLVRSKEITRQAFADRLTNALNIARMREMALRKIKDEQLRTPEMDLQGPLVLQSEQEMDQHSSSGEDLLTVASRIASDMPAHKGEQARRDSFLLSDMSSEGKKLSSVARILAAHYIAKRTLDSGDEDV